MAKRTGMLLALVLGVAIALSGGPGSAATDVGDAVIVVRDVAGALEGATRVIAVKDDVFQGEDINTGSESAIEMSLSARAAGVGAR